MSASGAYDDRAAVGRRIGQARRELGLTQGALATRIGVTLGILDRYETGKADPSEKLAQIAEITARDVSWFTSMAQYEIESAEYAAELPAELGRRIAESKDLRGPTRQGLPEERIATLGEPSSWPETGDPSAHRPDLADGSGEEPAALAKRLDELQAALADEHRKHGDAVAKSARVQEDLERVTVDRQALADLLEQSRSELAGVRIQSEQLAQQVSALETEVRAADQRATEAADRLGQATTELEHRRDHERSLAAELELRQAELSNRSAELDRRETAVADAEKSVEDGRRALGDVELRASAVERREEAVRLREGELEHRAGMLADLARRLEELKSTAVDVGRPPRQDQHLLILANHGYRLVARWGAAPDPGELVDLEDGRFRCLRISASPFLGDDRLCAVLEPLTAASET